MQTDQDDQKAQGDGQKDNADKKSETEEMEVANELRIFFAIQCDNMFFYH